MKQYKAIFFDWDGTAVVSRKAPVDEIVARMKPLLQKGIVLAIISGTTYDNIAQGKLEQYFDEKELKYLYLGLGRGAFTYSFEKGRPVVFAEKMPDTETLLRIHDISYAIHRKLLEHYKYPTDIVFCRPNYCKVDLMADNDRGSSLFMQENEIALLRTRLYRHGVTGGLRDLLQISRRIGEQHGMAVSPTCDAKYLEVGISDKSDNVAAILRHIGERAQITAPECAFWGDEYVSIEQNVFGSDSFMMTEESKGGDFFDVSEVSGERPEGVQRVGGGVKQFLEFLQKQAEGEEKG
ncbi:MAG: HAD family hydrolase [Eubacteriales bacterium]|nr:HAD family hydrolase [Eubacteriales bacterium]